MGRGRYLGLDSRGVKHVPTLLGGQGDDDEMMPEDSGDAADGSGDDTSGRRVERGWNDMWDGIGKDRMRGIFQDVLDVLRPLANTLLGREDPTSNAFHVRSHSGPLHPFFLAPFWVSSKGLLEANKIGTPDWLGYGRGNEDPTVTQGSIDSFQGAIGDLLAIPREVPVGGQLITPGSPPTYAWNGPAAGGVTIDVFGIGFGWDSRECTANCLNGGECVPPYCLYVAAQVGQTPSSLVQWWSDSSISLKLPPGTGGSISLNITSGRNKQVRQCGPTLVSSQICNLCTGRSLRAEQSRQHVPPQCA